MTLLLGALFPPDTWIAAAQLFFALAIGHAVADFPLQGDFLATCKNRRYLVALNDASRPPAMWLPCMAAHCLIHAGVVWLLTGSCLLALAEFVIHWVLDWVKCEGRTTFVQDQALHYLSKIAYVVAGCTCLAAA